MKRDVLGGGQPAGLAAASARGRRPPKAGGGPTKYHQLAFRNSLHRIGITIPAPNQSLTNAYKKDGQDAQHIPPILMPSGDTYLSSR
jgi:hypothetical protein